MTDKTINTIAEPATVKPAATWIDARLAVDKVAAWPQMMRLMDGTLVAVGYNQPCHGYWEGDVDCWASEDDGKTWYRRGVVSAHEPGTVRGGAAAGVVASGELVAITTGHGNMYPVGTRVTNPDFAIVLEPWVCRSSDGGRTFRHSTGVPVISTADGVRQPIPFGKIIPICDTELGVCMYADRPPATGDRLKRDESHFFVSQDDGRTWKHRGLIATGHNETDVTAAADGSLLAAARSAGPATEARVDLFRSHDGGRTWAPEGPLTGPAQHPAHLLRLTDGRILLSFGVRWRGWFGLGTQTADPEGRQWSRPQKVLDFNHERCGDGGYPSSIEMADGSILTAFYASRSFLSENYHMGVVRWKVQV